MSYIFFFVALCIATVTDIIKREIPIYLFLIATTINTVYCAMNDQFPNNSNFLGFFVMTLIMTVAVLFGGGGGDILMMSLIGLSFGLVFSLRLFLISHLIYGIILIVSALIKKKSLKTYTLPLAPFVLIGFIISIVL